MVSLILTTEQFQETCDLLDVKPSYEGLYYSKQHPLKMYRMNEILVAIQDKVELHSKCKVINYTLMNQPLWRQSVPDLTKHISNTKR